MLVLSPQQSKLKSHQRGFSLVEMLVSVALFAIVVTATSGTLVVMMNANTKAQALYSVMTNLSFAIDSMTRNIRTGYAYLCHDLDTIDNGDALPGFNAADNNPEDGPCSGFVFTREINGQRTAYRRAVDANNNGYIEQRISAGPWQRITADDVNITRMQFRLKGSAVRNDVEQPYILLRIEGEVANANNEGAKFLLQTLITQQILDYTQP